jgi:hypothetical protein
MFNVIRSQNTPDVKKNYLSNEVIFALEKIFYGKCYLCEDVVAHPQIDHFIPVEIDITKKYDWNNLYYSCPRCNSIKSTTTGLLDCCDEKFDVFKAIKCLCATNKTEDVLVEAQTDDVKTKNTAQLLNRCYNEKNTAIRCISRKQLHEKIFQRYSEFLIQSNKLYDVSSSKREKDNAKDELKDMMDVSYPFSVFWKWHLLTDNFLKEYFPDF